MKKLAILCDNLNQTLLEITSYLKNKVKIVWISENKSLSDTAKSLEVDFKLYDLSNFNDYDLIAATDFKKEVDFKILKVIKTLLPAFQSDEPIKEAIEAKVNVAGVSVYFLNPFEIIAQYPIFIEKPYNYNQILFNLQVIEQILYPLVIEKLLNNEKFETKALMQQNSCSGNCNSCKGCH